MRSIANSPNTVTMTHMTTDALGSFHELVCRVQQGDESAALELFRRYEPHIRQVARSELNHPSARRQLDSMDICQSVMAGFFARMALSAFDLQSPQDLIKLLAVMTRNRALHHIKRQKALRRDVRRLAGDDVGKYSPIQPGPNPPEIAANKELLELVRSRLSVDERRLADWRGAGRSWQEIASELGEKPDATRARLTRALDRVCADLKIDGV